MNFSPLYHEYNPSNSCDERCEALASRRVGGKSSQTYYGVRRVGFLHLKGKMWYYSRGKWGKNGCKTARTNAQGHEVINVLLKSSAQREPWGSGGVAPRKKTRPFERQASVVCLSGRRETHAAAACYLCLRRGTTCGFVNDVAYKNKKRIQ